MRYQSCNTDEIQRRQDIRQTYISGSSIELNHELDVLRDTLDDMIDLLNPGGRLCIITFHSLVRQNCEEFFP